MHGRDMPTALWVPRMSSGGIERQLSQVVAAATVWEIETYSVGDGSEPGAVGPGQPSHVGSPPITNQRVTPSTNRPIAPRGPRKLLNTPVDG